ncbi:alkaline phosphatase D [Sphingomonas sp. SORGH_AS870]|uniref:alkaline phosphatase D family protein n=1 Tax=Sphingomonas sp. SORGH_AS_0870 TaxID=3041801 RepID=UPI00285D6D0E|nr:alkaline phosphatase D family protein [Sphingomonas sp. SORGH_AS_0870]MDR6147296.1 alkaline phosphatase D [Sphingomonas sp. SORGH_AS_0870]
MTIMNRRRAMALMGSGAALAMPAGMAQAATGAVSFDHGVASGDPAPDGAILWTHATPGEGDAARDVALTWHVAPIGGHDAVGLRTGRVSARAARDHTAKVEVTGLQPGRDYRYWFEAAGQRSPEGRFRTLPRGAVEDVVLAVVSCQLYPGGFFNAYDAIAKTERLDAVLHLGDYIYEYGADGYGTDRGHKLNRLPEPAHEIVTLADYRQRHAQVKRDPDMQAAHARAAFICVWDDHEVANDDWIGGAENHQPATEGDWGRRKAAAMQAYFEWMPIRDPRPGQPWEAINRSFDFGDLATLVMVETRLLARSKQVHAKGAAPEPDEYAAMMAERARPDRELLGANQLDWIERTLTRSVKAGTAWQVIGNQVVMARIDGPDLEKQMGPAGYAKLTERLSETEHRNLAKAQAGYRAGLPLNFDSWDGYPAARERLYAAFRRAGSRPVVLSGDSHAAWANDLYDANGTLVAAEFAGTSITSPSWGDMMPGIGREIAAANPKVVRFCDQEDKGWLHLTLTRDSATARYMTVSTVMAKPYAPGCAAIWRTRTGAAAPIESLPA